MALTRQKLMNKSMDNLAADLVSGKESCSGCEGLNSLVEAVRNDQISMEEFKDILNDAKQAQLRQVV